VVAKVSTTQPEQPGLIKGFETINRYWDKTHNVYTAKILPGEYYVTAHGEMITTVLGSCVSACIRDRVFGIGGMNHFMLPLKQGSHWCGEDQMKFGEATRYGQYAMEHMINSIFSNGGHRKNLEIKLFGGGRMFDAMSDIGKSNIEFVRTYLQTENFTVVAEDLGGIHPRKILYFPATGKVRMKKLEHMHNDTIASREKDYRHKIEEAPSSGAIDLF